MGDQPGSTHRPLSSSFLGLPYRIPNNYRPQKGTNYLSSFLGLPYRIPNIDHKKELLRGPWVLSKHFTSGRRFHRRFRVQDLVRGSGSGCLGFGLGVQGLIRVFGLGFGFRA